MHRVAMISEDPFRLFFPLGLALGLLGVSPWVALLWSDGLYPVIWHRLVMTNGFMLSFVVGFLMTAIPRFTKSEFARPWEWMTILLWILLSTLALALGKLFLHYIFSTFAVVFLIGFAAHRFIKRAENPPYTFLFVGVSLIFWALANLMHAGYSLQWIEFGPWSSYWSKLLYEGVVLGLIIGVGGRLIPALLGWQEIVLQQRQTYEQPISFLKVVPKSLMVLVSLFFASYFLEAYSIGVANAIRTLILFYIGIRFWRVHRFPAKKNRLSYAIWIAAWVLLLSSLLPWIWFYAPAHGAHSYFIAGFSLLTLLIATRVTVAHTGASPDLETKSKMIPALVILVLLAAITRVTAAIWPNVYLNHLAYSAILWMVAAAIWGAVALPLLTVKGEEKSH